LIHYILLVLTYLATVNGYGNSALHEAAHDENLNAVEILLRAGAHVHTKNHKGSTPLHSLCYSEAKKADGIRIAEALIDAGAEIDAEDKHHATPLLVCCTSGR
jgi:ankyrin repeat protein